MNPTWYKPMEEMLEKGFLMRKLKEAGSTSLFFFRPDVYDLMTVHSWKGLDDAQEQGWSLCDYAELENRVMNTLIAIVENLKEKIV